MHPRASGYVFLHLDDATADGTAFGRRHDRAGGAIGTSVATHALLLLVVWSVLRVPPPVARPSASAPVLDPPPFVYKALGGESGGPRAGGPDRPAARAQTRPRDAIAVAAPTPTPLAAPPEIAPERAPTPAPVVGVVPMDAGQVPQIGTVDGPSAPPGPGGAGGGDGTGMGPDDGPGRGRAGRGVSDGPFGPGDGVSAPRILYQTQPQYTTEAMRAKIQGVALLSGVVMPDGTLQQIRIARSLDGTFGLDQAAITCVRQWRFRPGTKDGRAVPVLVTIEVAFNLR